VGDLRNCIVALSQGNQMWSRLFQHRFEGDNGLSGHALGNLIMTALVQRSGGLTSAIGQLTRALRLRGRIYPVTEDRVTLHAEGEDGVVVRGESQIPRAGRRIAKIWLDPELPEPAPGVLQTLAEASAIVIGPGSLYTSILPNLLVDGVVESIRESRALRIFVCNLMTEPGETDGMDALDHLLAIERHVGPGLIDTVAASTARPSDDRLSVYAEQGARRVRVDREAIATRGVRVIERDLLAGGDLIRHDPEAVRALVVELLEAGRG
jgi:uncharacterized cofD-like protein